MSDCCHLPLAANRSAVRDRSVDRRQVLAGGVALAATGLAACGAPRPAAAQVHGSAAHRFRVATVAEGLDVVWSIAFLPNGDVLLTERDGRIRRIREGRLDLRPLQGVPAVWDSGQGGLLDLMPHPDFASNRLLYLTYSKPGPRNTAGTAVAVARLDGDRLSDLRVLFEAEPSSGGRHFGSRLGVGGDGKLYVTAGDRGERDRAQITDDAAGSVWRLNLDGSVPADNPFRGRDDALPQLYSIGHRNPQGLAVHPQTGRVWIHEHGPRGGDEINLLSAGRNYGWPVITYGREYSGGQVGAGLTEKPGLEQPKWYWVPSIAPSGMAFYTGDPFPQWRGSLFVGALRGELLARLDLDGERVVREERLLDGEVGRVRDVRQGPDGLIWLAVDTGMVLRLEPV